MIEMNEVAENEILKDVDTTWYLNGKEGSRRFVSHLSKHKHLPSNGMKSQFTNKFIMSDLDCQKTLQYLSFLHKIPPYDLSPYDLSPSI